MKSKNKNTTAISSVSRYIYPELLQNSNILFVLIIRVCSNISRVVVVNAACTIMNESVPSTFSSTYVFNVKEKLFEKFTDLEVRIKIWSTYRSHSRHLLFDMQLSQLQRGSWAGISNIRPYLLHLRHMQS